MKRRNFLKTTAAAATFAAPTIIPSSVLGQGDKVAPSNRITLGLIGCGGQGTGDMKNLMRSADIQTVAVCDPDKGHAEGAQKHVEKEYAKDKAAGTFKGCDLYNNYAELIARDDIDAVIVGTPDHWHGIATVAALRAGKDVYCEKPITHLFREGQIVYKEAAKRKAVFQVGSQQRSDTRFRVAAEAVMNGVLGKIHSVEVGLPKGKGTNEEGKVPHKIPAGLDYDLWCGPSRLLPFNTERLHWNWRWCLDYGGGQLMDWIGHHNDIAHWGLEMDKSGPISVQAKGFDYPEKGIWDAPLNYEVISEYAGGYTVSLSNRHTMGTKWIGENGWIYVTRGKVEASNKDWIIEKNDRGPKKAYVSRSHHQNFVDCVKSREATICPAETGHRSATPGHIGYVSQALGGKKLMWDAAKEEITGNPEAEKMLKALNYRDGYSLEEIA
jgi:predicted dehydrogenase